MTKETEDPLHSLGQLQTSLSKAEERTHHLPVLYRTESASGISHLEMRLALGWALGQDDAHDNGYSDVYITDNNDTLIYTQRKRT